MRGVSLSRWLGRNLVTQQVSAFAALSIARIRCCEPPLVREVAKAGRGSDWHRGGSVVDDGPLGGTVLSKAEFPFWR